MARLTDAEVCIAKIKDMPVTYDSETVQRCIEIVSNAQTIDAEPVRHGKWREYPISDGMNQCSECGVLRFGKSNYCPNCGARMDKDE